jgi:hypothetical protein
MKNHPVMSVMVCAVLLAIGMRGEAAAKAAPFFTINSPDHPRAWFVAADFSKLDQSLSWNERDQSLHLDITYTLQGEWPLHDDPDLYNNFTVHFPAVRLDPDTRQLYFLTPSGKKMGIGSLQPSFFGHRIVLNENVSVIAHRLNGVIQAALVVYPPDRR